VRKALGIAKTYTHPPTFMPLPIRRRLLKYSYWVCGAL